MRTFVAKALTLAGELAGAAVIIAVLNWISLGPFRKSRGQHWTERARKLYPVRQAATTSILVVPLILVLSQGLLWPKTGPHWLLSALAGWIGATLGGYPLSREVFAWIKIRAWFHQTLTLLLMLNSPAFVLLIIAGLMPEAFDWRTWTLGAGFVIFLAAWSCGGMIWVARNLGLLTAAPARLQAIVDNVSAHMQVAVRRTWVLKGSFANAIAYPATGDLVFLDRLLAVSPDHEIAAIAAHEIGHLCESKSAIAGRFLGRLFLLPWIFIKPMVHVYGVLGYFTVAGLSLAWIMWFKHVSRRLEKRADALATRADRNPGDFARALEHLYEENLMPAVMRRKSMTHPDLYDRLLACGIQPDYPRPPPPSSFAYHVVLLGIVGILAAAIILKNSWAEIFVN
jgi:Zn-dependent protease with chaperone function